MVVRPFNIVNSRINGSIYRKNILLNIAKGHGVLKNVGSLNRVPIIPIHESMLRWLEREIKEELNTNRVRCTISNSFSLEVYLLDYTRDDILSDSIYFKISFILGSILSEIDKHYFNKFNVCIDLKQISTNDSKAIFVHLYGVKEIIPVIKRVPIDFKYTMNLLLEE